MSRRPYDPADEPIDATVLERLLETVAPQTPPPALREKVLARARGAARALPDFTTVRARAPWTSLLPGIEFKMLVYDEPAGTKSFLLRAAPGVRMPAHNHRHFEECLVLDGEFQLGDLRLRAGDYHAAQAGASHGEAYTETGTVVYLRAAIEDYPGVNP